MYACKCVCAHVCLQVCACVRMCACSVCVILTESYPAESEHLLPGLVEVGEDLAGEVVRVDRLDDARRRVEKLVRRIPEILGHAAVQQRVAAISQHRPITTHTHTHSLTHSGSATSSCNITTQTYHNIHTHTPHTQTRTPRAHTHPTHRHALHARAQFSKTSHLTVR